MVLFLLSQNKNTTFALIASFLSHHTFWITTDLRIIGGYENNPPANFKNIETLCEDELKKHTEYKSEYDNYYRVFVFYNRLGGFVIEKENKETELKSTEGYTANGKVVLFANVQNNTYSHELIHALGLEHTFNNKEQYKENTISVLNTINQQGTELDIITFLPGHTDNIVDYPMESIDSDKMYSLSKWQWELLNHK